ncbi:MAG TPA: transketolase C-terminal domain-containing protein, partial [Symbiobacteriaceae bacterium]|nr:transketolase C-terminal domain-containing protein [Symbiobacteriaceae bacterium]
MVRAGPTALRPLHATGLEAVLIGLIAGGCRLAFASGAAMHQHRQEVGRLHRRLRVLGGAVVEAQSDSAAAAMAAGAAMQGARAAALVLDAASSDCALSSLDDLTPVMVDVSGRLPVGLNRIRHLVAPHTTQAAFEAGRGAFARAEVLRGPGMVAGLEMQQGQFLPELRGEGEEAGPVPVHHTGPDNPDLLLLGAGPGFEACLAAREQLAAQGVSVAHLHLLQVAPFPGAIVAPVLTSSRRVVVVEPGGPGVLAGYVRSHLGAPVEPFGELPRLTGDPT